MAHGADPGPVDPASDTDSPFTLTRALRFLEGLAFCCLATLAIVWVVDRSRDLDFDPISVEICDGAACTEAPADPAGRAYAQYTNALDQRGLIAFTPANVCTFAADLLRNRASEDSVPLALELMQTRGTITLTRPGDGTALIAPGPNNDGLGDVLRDALRWQSPRGCHPMNYKPLFWPLWTVWMLLINWRLFRYRQSVWAQR